MCNIEKGEKKARKEDSECKYQSNLITTRQYDNKIPDSVNEDMCTLASHVLYPSRHQTYNTTIDLNPKIDYSLVRHMCTNYSATGARLGRTVPR